jgi:hypothetical protein
MKTLFWEDLPDSACALFACVWAIVMWAVLLEVMFG